MQRRRYYVEQEALDPPGATIYHLRHKRGWTQRELADHCRPAIDHSTIRRVELNLGYTRDTLLRIATALGVTIQDLFMPTELADYTTLPENIRTRLAETVQDAAAAYKVKKTQQTKG